MTPRKLTPAEALAMFKDWQSPDVTVHDFVRKWSTANPITAAIAALEEALAHKPPAAPVPSDEEIVKGGLLRLDECSDERIAKQLQWARECERHSALCTLVEMLAVRIKSIGVQGVPQ